MTNIKIILGGTRDSRLGDKVFSWVVAETSKNHNINTEGIDLKQYNIPDFHIVIFWEEYQYLYIICYIVSYYDGNNPRQ